jgi:BirA family biotin operon repressor/biotin-[acetyl-CoA-carboxylase] ligase
MARIPDLPPLYTALRLDGPDAFAAAIEAARGGAEAATFVWSARTDAADMAVVLRPDEHQKHPLNVAYVAMNALGDALAHLLPVELPVEYEWPDRVLINSGVVGGIRLAASEARIGIPPEWIVLGVLLAVEADPDDEPGNHPDVTTFGDELGPDDRPTAADIMDAFGRTFLQWTARWQDAGFAPVARAWLDRALGRHGPVFGRAHFLKVRGIDDDGSALLEQEKIVRVAPIAQALKRKTWWLPDRFGAAAKPEAA